MSINMADVKQIINNANNKEVVKIEDGLGNVLWQKQSAKVLQSIVLSGQTTSLNRNASFSFGGVVTANYSDGSTADVTADTTFSGYNMATSGTYTVTASYTEDSTTVTATYSLTVNPVWTTIYNNNSGKKIMALSGNKWTLGSVPANVSNKATKLRITYKPYVSTAGTNANYIRVVFNTSSTSTAVSDGTTVYPKSNTSRTDTFNYTQGRQIMHVSYSLEQVTKTENWGYGWASKAAARWYRNGLSSIYTGGNWSGSRSAYVLVTKLEEYY